LFFFRMPISTVDCYARRSVDRCTEYARVFPTDTFFVTIIRSAGIQKGDTTAAHVKYQIYETRRRGAPRREFRLSHENAVHTPDCCQYTRARIIKSVRNSLKFIRGFFFLSFRSIIQDGRSNRAEWYTFFFFFAILRSVFDD